MGFAGQGIEEGRFRSFMVWGVPLRRGSLAQVQTGWTRNLHSPDAALGWAHSLAMEG